MKRKLLLGAISAILFVIPFNGITQTSWTAQTSGTTDTLFAVQFLDVNNGYAGGSQGTMLKTTDGGTNWTDISISSVNPVNDIYFTDNSTGWVAIGNVDDGDNSGEIWGTTDGGTTWTNLTFNSTRARLGISFADGSLGWACGSRNGPLDISNTTDSGSNWAEQSDGAIFGWTYKIDALSTTDVWTVGGAFFPSVTGMIIHSTDGGSTWVLQSVGTIPFLYDLEAIDASNILVAGDQGAIMATTDGGANWTTQTSGSTEILRRLSFTSTTAGVACGDNGTILSTTDGGTTWAAETSGITTDIQGVYMIDGTVGYAVGEGGTILKRDLTTLNIKENTNGSTINAYPNPFDQQTTIVIDEFLTYNSLEFSLYDIVGNKVFNKLVDSKNFILDRGSLSNGIYQFTVTSSNNIIYTGKLILK
jgi:photosystem II stability/assembly factor-like uncharacterized protein